MPSKMLRKVIVGISGGVDSAVTAHLLKQKGFNVQGAFLRNWDTVDETGYCSAEKDWDDAQFVCDKLQIPIQRIEFVKQYWTDVFEKALQEYRAGETPNPDIYCNKYIKFDAFFQYAKEKLSADAIATGHYAATSFGPFLEDFQASTNVKLMRAQDQRKDQTLFLSQVSQDALRQTMFPLSTWNKKDVKQLANHIGLEEIVRKRESMGICFIGKRKFSDFLDEYLDAKPGICVDIDTGAVIGQHNGLHHYNIGKRIRNTRNAPSAKHYVVEKIEKNQTVLAAKGRNHLSLYSDLFYTADPHWIDKSPFELDNRKVVNVEFRFQHGHPTTKCRLFKCRNGLIVNSDDPFWAIMKGQFAVFYRDNECLGSAKISGSGPSLYFTSKRGASNVSRSLGDCLGSVNAPNSTSLVGSEIYDDERILGEAV